MAIAKQPSVVTMPAAEKPYPSIVDFLCQTFPAISRNQWMERIRKGKVLDNQGHSINTETMYSPSQRIFYFREVENEPVIPFAEQILFQDDELLVACKPHFLPVIPGGQYVEECLLNRLRNRTGITDVAPLHRLDRETAGSGRGSSGTVIVSPMFTSSKPATAMISPGPASSTSTRLRPSN